MEQMFRSDRQDEATIKEFVEAFQDGHLERAWAIYRANPDLQSQFDHEIGYPTE